MTMMTTTLDSLSPQDIRSNKSSSSSSNGSNKGRVPVLALSTNSINSDGSTNLLQETPLCEA
jgi:hypothetical protein